MKVNVLFDQIGGPARRSRAEEQLFGSDAVRVGLERQEGREGQEGQEGREGREACPSSHKETGWSFARMIRH